MRHNKRYWRYDNLHGWSPRRIVAAKLAIGKEAARVQAKRDEVALFPELQEAHQPRFTTVEERQAQMGSRELWLTREFRASRVAMWRKARCAYFSTPTTKRAGIKRLWDRGAYPADPAYLCGLIDSMTKPGHSAWTYLRKLRLVVLWREGRVARPERPMDITRNFSCI